MTPDPGSFDPRRSTRRQLLKAGGLSLGAREANDAFLGEDVDRYEQA